MIWVQRRTKDVDGDGEPEVLLGGVNDAPEYKQATLVIFDHRRISGATVDPEGRVYFQGMSPGTEKWVVFFPRTPVSLPEEFNIVADVRPAPGRITVTVSEGTSGEEPAMIYEFDFALRPINAMLGGDMVRRYRELREQRKLPESAEALAQRMMREIKVIRGRY